MSLTLGEKLRQAREERGISISEVAEQTRISPHYLDSIENDDYRTLPGGIFNKGFVKSYAKYVGVDEQEALQDYSRLISSQEGEVTEDPKTYRPEVLTDDRTSASTLPTIIIAVIILGLMAWGLITLVNYIQNNQNAPVVANTNTAVNSNIANVNTNTNANIAQPIASTNEIKVEFKALVDKINVTYWTDGKMVSKDVLPNETLSMNPQQSVKISYYKGFTPDKVQITVNGKQIPAPASPVKGNTTFEINKENIAQILQSGQFAAPSNNANTATPR
jgi:cytoskeleton protein RodZ